MFNEVTTQWLPRNTHGAHAACISGIVNVHKAHKLRTVEGTICRRSAISQGELMTMIARYTLLGMTITTVFCCMCVTFINPHLVGVRWFRSHTIGRPRNDATRADFVCHGP